MDNNSILCFAIMTVLLVLVFWQVYFVHQHKINTLQLEHESGLSCSKVEGMYTSGADLRFMQKPSERFFGGSEPPVFYDIGNIQAARAMRNKKGYKFSAGKGQDGIVLNKYKKDNPRGGYTIVQKDLGKRDPAGNPIMSGVLVKDGVALRDTSSGGPGMSFYKTGDGPDDKWLPCPTAEHRTSADGYSCYIPENMTGQHDQFAEIEDTVYGG